MRKHSRAAVALILGIAFYFTLAWGYDALRMLTGPAFGLDDVWRSQFIFVIGHLFGLEPIGLIKLAAFVATLKLAAASICAVHLLDRLRTLFGGTADTDILEAGLILIVAISIVSVGPAVWAHDAALLREHVIQLLLAAIATGLCLVEANRSELGDAEAFEPEAETVPATTGAPLKIWKH
ncbi:MAG TPA: hypothetical protein VHV56_05385 [Pseudolabrys sp.]|jgi:hypothetical protein|nr:hypothetical protein [Pseudolabrys sp.]